MRIKSIVTSLVSAIAAVPVVLVLSGTAQAAVPPEIERGDIYYSRNITKNTEFGDPTNADKCDLLQYKIRIHNHGPTEIARNVKVNVVFPTAASTKNISTAVIKADNIYPTSTSDSATVNISTSQKISYVDGSTELLDSKSNFIKNLPDVTKGSDVNIGNVGVSTNEKRFVQFKARVNCPEQPPVSSGVCELLTLTVLNRDQREVRAHLTGSVNNATITGYSINFGDGTVVNQQSATHKYAAAGTYNVRGTVQIRLANGDVVTRTADSCTATVRFAPPECVDNPQTEEDECNPCVNNPQTPEDECNPCVDNPTTPMNECKPTTPEKPGKLPDTGAGDIIAAFFSVTVGGMVAYNLVLRRFAGF